MGSWKKTEYDLNSFQLLINSLTMKKVVLGIITIISFPLISFSQLRYENLAIGLKLGRPYFTSFENVSPSNFSEINLGIEFPLNNSVLTISPMLGLNRFLFSSNRHFVNTPGGYEFRPVPDSNYSVSRLELFTTNAGIAFGMQRKIAKQLSLKLVMKPFIGLSVSNRNLYFQNGVERKDMVGNNPLLYGGDVSLSIMRNSANTNKRIGASLGVLATNGRYIHNSNLRMVVPYVGIICHFVK